MFIWKIDWQFTKCAKTAITALFQPSKDSLSAQAKKPKKLLTIRSLKEKLGKPSDGQLDHKVITLEMASESDLIVEHQPYFCTCCRNDLSVAQGTVVEVRQVVDIPMPVRHFSKDYQLLVYRVGIALVGKKTIKCS